MESIDPIEARIYHEILGRDVFDFKIKNDKLIAKHKTRVDDSVWVFKDDEWDDTRSIQW